MQLPRNFIHSYHPPQPSLLVQRFAPLVDGFKSLDSLRQAQQQMAEASHVQAHNLAIQTQNVQSQMAQEFQQSNTLISQLMQKLSGHNGPVYNGASFSSAMSHPQQVVKLVSEPPARVHNQSIEAEDYYPHERLEEQKVSLKGEPLLDKISSPAYEFLNARVKRPHIQDTVNEISRKAGRKTLKEPRPAVTPDVSELRRKWSHWSRSGKNSTIKTGFDNLFDTDAACKQAFDRAKNDFTEIDRSLYILRSQLERTDDTALTPLLKFFSIKPGSDHPYKTEFDKIKPYAVRVHDYVSDAVKYLENKKYNELVNEKRYDLIEKEFNKVCNDSAKAFSTKFQKAYGRTFDKAKHEELVEHLKNEHQALERHYQTELGSIEEAEHAHDHVLPLSDVVHKDEDKIQKLKDSAGNPQGFSIGRGLTVGGTGIAASFIAAASTHLLLGGWAATKVLQLGTAASLAGGAVATASEGAWKKAGQGQFFDAAQELYTSVFSSKK